MKLRPATLDDAKLLLSWRNDPATRANSRDTGVISWNSHEQWLKSVLDDGSRTILIAEVEGCPVATCRIDSDGELSWNVSPEHRGRGYGLEMVRMVIETSSEPRFAAIRSSNAASLSIVKRLGFEQVSNGEVTEWRWVPEPKRNRSGK